MRSIAVYVHRVSLVNSFLSPLFNFFENEFDIYIYHIDSFQVNEYPMYKFINISSLNNEKISESIRFINPEIFISLGFISINEFYILKVCKYLKIKTIYIEHGIISEQTLGYSFKNIFKNFNEKLIKNCKFLKNNYELSICTKTYKVYLEDFINAILLRRYYNCKFDTALFYTKYSFDKINKYFRYNSSNYKIVGIPIDINEHLKENKSLFRYKSIKYAIYIQQPFISDGLVNYSYEDEKQYLCRLSRILSNINIKLVLLLHPRSNFREYKKRFTDTGIFIENEDKFRLLEKSSFVLGHYSTFLLTAAYLKKKIIIIPYLNYNFDYSAFKAFCLRINSLKDISKIKDMKHTLKFEQNIISFEQLSQELKTYIN